MVTSAGSDSVLRKHSFQNSSHKYIRNPFFKSDSTKPRGGCKDISAFFRFQRYWWSDSGVLSTAQVHRERTKTVKSLFTLKPTFEFKTITKSDLQTQFQSKFDTGNELKPSNLFTLKPPCKFKTIPKSDLQTQFQSKFDINGKPTPGQNGYTPAQSSVVCRRADTPKQYNISSSIVTVVIQNTASVVILILVKALTHRFFSRASYIPSHGVCLDGITFTSVSTYMLHFSFSQSAVVQWHCNAIHHPSVPLSL